PEDLIPVDLLRRLTREWSSPTTIVLEAVLDGEDAEAVREQLAAGRHHEACGLLLDRGIEVHPIVPDVSESCLKIDEERRRDAAPGGRGSGPTRTPPAQRRCGLLINSKLMRRPVWRGDGEGLATAFISEDITTTNREDYIFVIIRIICHISATGLVT